MSLTEELLRETGMTTIHKRAIERFTASQLAEEMEQTLDAAVENTENAAAVAREGTPITSH